MFPIDMYTGQYWLWPVTMETVVLLLPSIIGTNIDPCVSGSWAMMSCIDYLWVIPARVKYIRTNCLFPNPVARHEIVKVMIIVCVILIEWWTVKFAVEVRISEHIMNKFSRIAKPNFKLIHPWWPFAVGNITIILHGEAFPWYITDGDWTDCVVKVSVVAEWWVIIM
jgi:hypothetical protein